MIQTLKIFKTLFVSCYFVCSNVCLLWCLDKGFQLQETETLAPAPESVNFGKVVVTPELHFKEKPTEGRILNFPYLKFRCEFEEEEGLFYYVAWLDFIQIQ